MARLAQSFRSGSQALFSCSIFGLLYGALVGSVLFGVMCWLTRLNPADGHFDGGIELVGGSLWVLAILFVIAMGAVLGAWSGVFMGLLGGVLHKPWGWSVSAVIAGFLALDSVTIAFQGGHYGPTQRPVDNLTPLSLCIFLVALGLSGGGIGKILYQQPSFLPLANWVNRCYRDSPVPHWIWPWRVAILLAFALPVIAIAIHCPSNYRMDIGNFRDDRAGQRVVLRRLTAMISACPHAARYTLLWSYEGQGPGGVVPEVTVYNLRTHKLRHYWQEPALQFQVDNVTLHDLMTVTQSHGDFHDLKRQVQPQQKQQRSKSHL